MSRRRSLGGRLLAAYAVTFLAVIALLGFVVDVRLRSHALGELTDQMVAQTRQLARLAPTEIAELDGWVSANAALLDARVTVVDSEGVVLADSAEDPSQMENHADRPEVMAALAGAVGTSRRFSDTLHQRLLYVAVPLPAGGAVRVASDDVRVERFVGPVTSTIVTLAIVAGLIGVGVVYLVARAVSRPIVDLTAVASKMAAGSVEARAPRAKAQELDRLGAALNDLNEQLGGRLADVERERNTLDAVLSALDQAVILVGGDRNPLYANPTAHKWLGPDLKGSGLIRSLVDTAMDSGEAQLADGVEVGTPGRLGRPLRVSVTPFAGRVLVVATDITDARRIDQVRRDFVADASHELKTPVASVLASSEMLQTALARDPHRADEFAQRVHDSATQLARLVADLLDLSRLESGIDELADVDLEKVVRNETSELAPRAAELGVEWQVATVPLIVAGREADLGLAVHNLLDNALRHTPRGGSISVSLEVVEGQALISVADTGEGIPRRAVDRVFERFFRVDVARSRHTGGTGLGLSIVKHVAESHGGSARVESELGSGSTFSIRIPLAAGGG